MKYLSFVVLTLWMGLLTGCVLATTQLDEMPVDRQNREPISQTIALTTSHPIAITTSLTSTPTLTSTSTLSSALTFPSNLGDYGIQIYQQQYCGICHELDAANTKGLFGPTHNGMATIAEKRIQNPAYTGTATTPEEYLMESLTHPDRFLVLGYESTPHRMPAYTFLGEMELEALVQMLLAQK